MSVADRQKRCLDEDGFLVLPAFMSAELLGALRARIAQLFAEEGDEAGAEFKQEPGCGRLANLVDKGEVFRAVIGQRAVLDCVEHVLGPAIKLSSLNARSVPPGAGAQPLHADMRAVADARGPWVCNTVWLLDDFTAANGTIRLVPGSHRWRRLPQDALADPAAPHPDEVRVEANAGSVIVMNAHLWHGGTANTTSKTRTAVHAFYARRDKPQQQYQKRWLRPEVQEGLSAELRYLLALDDPLNDQLSADVPMRSGFLK
jgi:ectoine hydroxylase-related dioxygenase (phytanoyl-CoA dioxygenase family)